EPYLENEDLELPGLGLCFPISTHIVAVRPDSPAAKARLKPGDVINRMIVKPRKPAGDRPAAAAARPLTIDFDDQSISWATAFSFPQDRPWKEVDLVVNKASEPIRITPELVPNWFYPVRGLGFYSLIRKLPPQAISAALQRGFDDTIENI